jgi:hypothetical protein
MKLIQAGHAGVLAIGPNYGRREDSGGQDQSSINDDGNVHW